MTITTNDKRIKIGVLFCGGCNPNFDRENLYLRIVSNLSKCFDFIFYSEIEINDPFDYILLINGCESECLMDLNYEGTLIVINSANYSSALEIIHDKVLPKQRINCKIKG